MLDDFKRIVQFESTKRAFEQIGESLSNDTFQQMTATGPEIQVDDKKLKTYELLIGWNVFAAAGIPFSQWEDIAALALKALIAFLETPGLEFEELPQYQALIALKEKRLDELKDDPRLRDLLRS